MNNNQKFYAVIETNVLSNDSIAIATYQYLSKAEAQSKLFKLWGYAVNPPSDETRQLLSASMMEYAGDRAILLESRVFDYREPEPEPVPPNEEE